MGGGGGGGGGGGLQFSKNVKQPWLHWVFLIIRKRMSYSNNQLISYNVVEQPLALPGSAKCFLGNILLDKIMVP